MLKAEIKIPKGYERCKVGWNVGFEGEDLRVLAARPDHLKVNLEWQKWDTTGGTIHVVRRGEMFIRDI